MLIFSMGKQNARQCFANREQCDGNQHDFNAGDQFLAYLRDSFDVLYAEGADCPRIMSVGMHCRILGRPGRFIALKRFLDHVQRHDRVWVCRRIDIARHWRSVHPAG